ncbi:hypothetical protein V2I84_05255 [Pseudomonas viridiflava]|uniref:hypothetical protein n=1 Tax=Pseudomonas viridiflava TaxID=33069 RepID=UPI002EA191DA|nr:hypothetical protein [Pseudomonas viridiflava]MEE3980862.1 hypothetical protein [Pseudomonas viridiflava]MEE3989596.1 hypothetical protein [Pseudomonas viridiflava]MEE4028142.1 hypothetical protein [Pseudomonas viridiflava]MEE4034306.1 hypothetical protein [Pseudomonas viridiflava]
MSIEKVREEYEAWVLREYPSQHMGRFATGEYHSTVIEDCWLAWRASREELLISMPIDVTGGLYRLAVEDCTRCIEAAGVKVKS